MSLQEYRDKLELEAFFEDGETRTLDDLIRRKTGSFGEPVRIEVLAVRRLFSHKLWDDPDPTGQIAARLAKDDATTASSLFDEAGLTVPWLLGV